MAPIAIGAVQFSAPPPVRTLTRPLCPCGTLLLSTAAQWLCAHCGRAFCRECGGTIARSGGCDVCTVCGAGSCG